MNFWDARWMEKMRENQIARDLEDRYMDDIRVILMALKDGWRWFEDGFYWCQEWEQEDRTAGVSQEDRTSKAILDSMNSILDFLIFTKESPGDFPDGKLPTLDIKVWLENLRIWYQFFQKPMSNNVVIQEQAALSEMVKVSSLTEEVVRRLKHTSRGLEKSYRLETLEDFSQRMSNSGHKSQFMKRVLLTGIAKYEKKVEESLLDKRDPKFKPLHQPSGRSQARLRKKAMARETWFRNNSSQQDSSRVGGRGIPSINLIHGCQPSGIKKSKLQPSSVMFLPSTKGGMLLKKMRENEDRLVDMTGFKISYSEAGGVKLGRMFSTNLARDQPCGRGLDKCIQCNTGNQSQNCKARCVLYESCCLLCNPVTATTHEEGKSIHEEGGEVVANPPEREVGSNPPLRDGVMKSSRREGVYLGETSRSLAERTIEHFNDAEAFSKRSHMVKHWMTSHMELDTIPPFQIKVVKQYRDCLSRQVGEAIAILLTKDKLLNSKNEYIQNCISRITVQEDMLERKKRIQREEEEDKAEEEKLKEFKKEKRPTKRRMENIPNGWKESKRRKVDQEFVLPQLTTVEEPHHEQVVEITAQEDPLHASHEEPGRTAGQEHLRLLRERMKMESMICQP